MKKIQILFLWLGIAAFVAVGISIFTLDLYAQETFDGYLMRVIQRGVLWPLVVVVTFGLIYSCHKKAR